MALRNFLIIMNTFTALPFPFPTPKIKIEKVRGLFPLVLPSRGVTRLSLSTHFFYVVPYNKQSITIREIIFLVYIIPENGIYSFTTISYVALMFFFLSIFVL